MLNDKLRSIVCELSKTSALDVVGLDSNLPPAERILKFVKASLRYDFANSPLDFSLRPYPYACGYECCGLKGFDLLFHEQVVNENDLDASFVEEALALLCHAPRAE